MTYEKTITYYKVLSYCLPQGWQEVKRGTSTVPKLFGTETEALSCRDDLLLSGDRPVKVLRVVEEVVG